MNPSSAINQILSSEAKSNADVENRSPALHEVCNSKIVPNLGAFIAAQLNGRILIVTKFSKLLMGDIVRPPDRRCIRRLFEFLEIWIRFSKVYCISPRLFRRG